MTDDSVGGELRNLTTAIERLVTEMETERTIKGKLQDFLMWVIRAQMLVICVIAVGSKATDIYSNWSTKAAQAQEASK